MDNYVVTYEFERDNRSISLFPKPVRCLIIGPSGSGKTNLIFNIVTKYWIHYDNLYVFTKNINQPVYEKMKEVFTYVDNIEAFITDEDIISVDDCKSNSLVIFDDYILDKQDMMKDYFIRSRSKNISCIYISQNYGLLDLKTIRQNCNFLIIFKQLDFYTKKIWKDLISSVIGFDKFKSLCLACWKLEFGFISINLTNNKIYNKFKLIK